MVNLASFQAQYSRISSNLLKNKIMRKNITLCLLTTILSFFVALKSSAQETAGESVFTLHAGLSSTGGVFKLANSAAWKATDTIDGGRRGGITSADISGGPAIVVGYDFGLSRRWSIGVIATTQSWKGQFDYAYFNANETLIEETVDVKLRRNNISLTPRIHYGNGGKIDLYSGLRLGAMFWQGSIDVSDPNFNELPIPFFFRPNLSLIPFGGRFYINDNIAISFELGMGAPYVFGIGGNYKL